jgi:hypothetical protein
VIIPWEGPPKTPAQAWLPVWGARSSAASESGAQQLAQRVRWTAESLRRIDLDPVQLSTPELTALFYETLCWDTARRQPLPKDPEGADWPSLVAPDGFEELPAELRLGSRLARTLAISRYPRLLRPGWLESLLRFEGDLDVSLHVQPSPMGAVMSFLERRIAELSSTVRVADESGRRADAHRRAALADAEELQDRLAQGLERLFDLSLYLTIWGTSSQALELATRRVEAVLGSMLLHSRRLLFQMEPGLISSLPLGLDRVGLRRSLPTSAVSATFPFSGNDISTRTGLLYGINPQAKSPVVLDRFALENHNASVFATSGAGKSYLVKVELIRARTAGIAAAVIDPEGEYASIVSALGGSIIAVSPGTAPALDPFAIPEQEPGSLSSRIATLMTLLELLGGELSANHRAAAEEALSFAYAARGFADDGRWGDLAPPNLGDVQARLRHSASEMTAGGEASELALRLQRYVSGAGAWLFRTPHQPTPSARPEVTAYVLSGVPEEDRAPAMFLVLDRIWSDLASKSRPTLVLVDEAWWLMQYPDTARFIHRLVKTARKRQAGLTLVTQDVTDVLSSPLGASVITNSALQILMKQAPQAIRPLAELFRLTPTEQSWLLNARRGEGLLLAQGKRVPFQVVASQEEARLIEGRPMRGAAA